MRLVGVLIGQDILREEASLQKQLEEYNREATQHGGNNINALISPSITSSPLGSPVAHFHTDCSFAPLLPPF